MRLGFIYLLKVVLRIRDISERLRRMRRRQGYDDLSKIKDRLYNSIAFTHQILDLCNIYRISGTFKVEGLIQINDSEIGDNKGLKVVVKEAQKEDVETVGYTHNKDDSGYA